MENIKQRFDGLEWLRFLLAVYVMVYHSAHRYPQISQIKWLSSITSMGFFATSTFFMLSGFLLTHVYFKTNKMRDTRQIFWAKRFCNLYPLHIFALLFSILVLFILQLLPIPADGPYPSPRFVVFDTNAIEGQINPKQFWHYMSNGEILINGVLQLFMLQAWNPFYLTFNAPLWSLSALFFFYLLFPTLTPMLLRIKSIRLAILLLMLASLLLPLFVIIKQLWGIPWTGMLQRVPLFRLPEFLCGILCYSLFRRHQENGYRPSRQRCAWLIVFVLVVFLLATWLFTQRPERFWYPLLHNGLLIPAQLILIYLCALLPESKTPVVQRVLPRLAASSLCIFALHVPLFNLWVALEPVLLSAVKNSAAGWHAWLADSTTMPLTLTGYVVFIALAIGISVFVQERCVVRTRKAMLKNIFKN